MKKLLIFLALFMNFIRATWDSVYVIKNILYRNDGIYIEYGIKGKYGKPNIKKLAEVKNKDLFLRRFSRDDFEKIIALKYLEKFKTSSELSYKEEMLNKKKKYLFFPFLIAASISSYDFTMFASHRVISIFGFTFPGGILIFPLIYFIANIVQEVYGFKRLRQLLWCIFMQQWLVLFFSIVTLSFHNNIFPINLTGYFHHHGVASSVNQVSLFNKIYEFILSNNVRNTIVNTFAIAFGLMVNGIVFAKIKNHTNGQMLWLRTIGATFAGEFVFSLIFCVFAFYGQLAWPIILKMQLMMFLFKVIYEIIFTPLTYMFCALIKQKEGIEVYDITTSFNPFKLFDLDYDKSHIKRKV